jgi:hypothetical protein
MFSTCLLLVSAVAVEKQTGKHKVVPFLTFESHDSPVTKLKIYLALNNCAPIAGKPSQSMVPHLSKCVLVRPDVRSHAVQEMNDKKNRCENLPNPPILGQSVSMPLPAIMMSTASYSSYQNFGLSTSSTPSGSPSPSPLLLSAPLLNLD